MPVAAETHQALDLKNLPAIPGLPVLGVQAEEHTDSSGEPSLRVTVTIADSVDEENISGKEIGDLKRGIRDSLRKHGITLFPYIFFVKPSELLDEDEG